MVRIDEAGAVRILRDPSGALPCYFLCEADRITLAGDIADLASPAPGQVDFEEIARVIASGDARGRRTCLKGIDELIAGERSEEHTSELQSLMRISYAVFCLKKKTKNQEHK